MKLKKYVVFPVLAFALTLSSCNVAINGSSNTSTPSVSTTSEPQSTTAIPSTTSITPSTTSNTAYYTVTFDTNGGSAIASLSVEDGKTISKPEVNPTKDNYAFEDWYKSNEYTEKYDFTKPITSNITIYAKFVEGVIISFYDTDLTDLCILPNSKITKPDNPTKKGYTFNGWFADMSLETPFNFDLEVGVNTTIYPKWEMSNAIELASAGYNEGLYMIFTPEAGYKAENYQVKYKESNKETYKSLDSELIRDEKPNVRFDILGLKQGYYDIKVYNNDSLVLEKSNIAVALNDRSGYAHFNATEGVGAYNNDGTLKDGTVVVYVTDETKNTVTATIAGKTYTGLSSILQAQSKSSVPLNIRIIGQISAATWNPLTVAKYSSATTSTVKGANNSYLALKSYSEEDIIKGGFNTLNTTKYTKLNGLTNKIKYDSGNKEFDSYYNMLDISNAKNVTVEGVGTDAKIFQWGFTWKSCNSIEVRNLTFSDYTEDACSFEASDSDSTLRSFDAFTSTRFWIHNNTFNKGINYWDVCSEQDKHEGDGATDFKRVCYVTISYNHYVKNHKTGLVGGSDSQMSASFTFHHNYYEMNQARLPYARQANLHMYNNYYFKSSGNNMQIYSGAYAFIENCYFEGINKTFIVDLNKTPTPAIKSFNNVFNNCKNNNGATMVSARDELVANGNVFDPNFDTNPNSFYYDAVNKVSNVLYMTDAEQAKLDCVKYAGANTICGPLLPEGAEYPDTPVIPDDDSDTGDDIITNTTILDPSNLRYNKDEKIEEAVNYGSFKIVGTSSKTVDVKAGATFSINGEEITTSKSLSLGGAATFNSARYIEFTTTSSAKITVVAKSSGSSTRTLNIVSAANTTTVLKTISATQEIVVETITLSNAGTYQIGSAGSGIYIFYILISYEE